MSDLNATYCSLAQSVERMTVNHDVVSSSLTGAATKLRDLFTEFLFYRKRMYGGFQMGVSNPCEVCMNYEYNDETDSYECVLDVAMDMDDYERSLMGQTVNCPFFKFGDEYNIVRKQN